jgi:uncharacterized protein YcaQ
MRAGPVATRAHPKRRALRSNDARRELQQVGAMRAAARQYRPPASTGRSGLQNRLAANTVAGGFDSLAAARRLIESLIEVRFRLPQVKL